MSKKLIDSIKMKQNKKFTENMGYAYISANSFLVDLFAQVGSMRYREDEIPQMVINALSEDELLTTKLAFYARDIRAGLGERKIARAIFQTLAEFRPEIMKKNLKYIAEFGRYDDLLCLLDSQLKDDVVLIIKNQLEKDLKDLKDGKSISLLGKWLPSINTSSKETRDLAKILINELEMDNKTYRKMLSELRSYLNVLEVRMSNSDYDYIRYNEVPSNAMNKYNNAFYRNDSTRFSAYLRSLINNETTINAKTLFPYDITYKLLYGNLSDSAKIVFEQQWKNLPNYVSGENSMLVIADVSGSMHGKPMATSVGLAIYFAERNKGVFHNKFMTFSSEPELVEIHGNSLQEKIISVSREKWEMSTNLQGAFDLILSTAIENNLKQDDLPKTLLVISDMEIDRCSDVDDWGFYDYMKSKYERNGYNIPTVVFWNVNARHSTFHASFNNEGVQLASGQSPSVFSTLVAGEKLSPYKYMVKVLSSERYDCITI